MIKKRKAFTLIELAAVIMIVAIIAGLGLTAFYKMSKGRNVEYATRILAAKLDNVRSYAMTNNTYAAMVFPNSTTTVLSSDYQYSSYRGCVLSSPTVFGGWIPNDNWNFMPKGTAVVSIRNSSSALMNDFSGTVSTITVTGGYLNNTINNTVDSGTPPFYLPMIIFTPSGIVYDGSAVPNNKYITVGELNYVYPSPGTTGTDIAVITISGNTGRIAY